VCACAPGRITASLPEELRRAYRDGDFSVGIRDADFQVIPTAWVLAAEARWKPDGAHGLSMTAMALDPAGGGRDSAELARRHGGWYAELISAKGQETADGSTTAAMVVRYRLDSAPVIVDVGGGSATNVEAASRLQQSCEGAHFAGTFGLHRTQGLAGVGIIGMVGKLLLLWW
jgi:hypothetical protein